MGLGKGYDVNVFEGLFTWMDIPDSPKEALDKLRGKLSQEYELYQFIRQRLKLQSRELTLWRKNHAKTKPIYYNKERKD